MIGGEHVRLAGEEGQILPQRDRQASVFGAVATSASLPALTEGDASSQRRFDAARLLERSHRGQLDQRNHVPARDCHAGGDRPDQITDQVWMLALVILSPTTLRLLLQL